MRRGWPGRRVTIEAVETLAGEPWGRVALERLAPVDDARRRRALVIGDVAVAAYLVGAAGHLVAITSQWLQDRVQFGRPIGQFQSLAHPLADVAIRTRAARAADPPRRVRRRQLGRRRTPRPRRRRRGCRRRGRRSTPRIARISRSARSGSPSKGRWRESANGSARCRCIRPGRPRRVSSRWRQRASDQIHQTRGNHTMEVDLTAPLEGLVYEKRDHIAYITHQPSRAGQHAARHHDRADQGDLGRGPRGPVDPLHDRHRHRRPPLLHRRRRRRRRRARRRSRPARARSPTRSTGRPARTACGSRRSAPSTGWSPAPASTSSSTPTSSSPPTRPSSSTPTSTSGWSARSRTSGWPSACRSARRCA